MSVKTVRHRLNLGSALTDRNPSPAIWSDCPWTALAEGSIDGAIYYEDFLNFNITPATTEGNWAAGAGGYAQFSSTGGTITAGTGTGGEAIFASDGDDEGASFRSLATPFKIIRTGKKLWFEARLKTSTIADTKHGFFLGLLENVALTATVPIAAAGTLSDNNFVGFHRLEGDGDKIDTVYKANGVTQVTVGADAITLVADTYIKVGMVFDVTQNFLVPDTDNDGSSKYLLTFYADNVRLADAKQIPSAAGTDFPNDVGLGFVFALLNATATTPGNTTLDWVRIAQLY